MSLFTKKKSPCIVNLKIKQFTFRRQKKKHFPQTLQVTMYGEIRFSIALLVCMPLATDGQTHYTYLLAVFHLRGRNIYIYI